MELFSLFDINNTLVNIPIGDGYAMSWIEAIGTIFGLLCIWFASQEKTINYLFGLINVTLFAVIFFQIQLYGLLCYSCFSFVLTFMAGMHGQDRMPKGICWKCVG